MNPFGGVVAGAEDFSPGFSSRRHCESCGFSGLIFRILLKLEARRVKVVSTVPREVVAEKKRSRDKSAE